MTATPPVFTHSQSGADPDSWAPVRRRARTVHFADLVGSTRLVVVAPHPDDESLGAGGLLAGWSSLGRPSLVVTITDGEAAGRTSTSGGAHDDVAAARLGGRRRAEQAAALDELRTRGPIELVQLGLPDGAIDDHVGEVTARVEALLRDDDLVVSPWPGDGHPDHHATGTAVRTAAARTGAGLLEYPVWLWHWGSPGELDHLPLVRVPLGPGLRDAKRRAIGAHRSQLDGDDPVLGHHVLVHFDHDAEVFVASTDVGSGTAVSRSAGEFFETMYAAAPDADPWGFAGSDQEQRRYDQVLAMVPRGDYRRCLEPGCGTGELTRRLRERCGHVVGIDVSATALGRAEATLAERAGPPGHTVELRCGAVPEALGDDDVDFDLVVLSELAYYFEPSQLAGLVLDLRDRASDDAVVLAAHWNGVSDDHRLSADDAHDVITEVLGTPSRTAELETFRVDLWLPAT